MSIIPFPVDRSSDRFRAVHNERLGLEALVADLGTPEEWLEAAVSHLKAETSGVTEGSASVSVAALHLVLMRLEELEHGGQPWTGGAA